MLKLVSSVAALAVAVSAHGDHGSQTPIAGPHKSLWYNTLPGDGGTQADSVFSGISTFGVRGFLIKSEELKLRKNRESPMHLV
jgi:agmatinase